MVPTDWTSAVGIINYTRITSVDSKPNDSMPEKLKTSKRLADAVKEKSTLMRSEKGSLSVYKIPLKEQQTNVDGCRYFSFGEDVPKQSRTIMVLGATGAGKSTLINGMINYILGVKWEDSFRFKLVDEDQSRSQVHSQTSEVTVYDINHQEGFNIPYSLTIVDTPGYGDTRGIERDREITEQIRNLFSSEHVSEIDAVCFVTPAALARLTPTQKYVFDSVFSIFGKYVAEHIQMLVTFADVNQPPVLEAVNVSGVPCPKNELGLPVHFKFNNSALFANNSGKSNKPQDENSDEDSDEDNDGFDEMFWKMGVKSMQKFFTALGMMRNKSLLMTQEVLKERQQCEAAIEGLQPQVRAGLAKLDEQQNPSETGEELPQQRQKGQAKVDEQQNPSETGEELPQQRQKKRNCCNIL